MKHIIFTLKSIILPMSLIISAAIYSENNAQAFTIPQSNNVYKDTQLEHAIGYKEVDRVEVLQNFFKKYNSPLLENSDTFVKVADQYNIDYRLLPAISCMESTCGKFLIEGSYNPFGWGVYGNQHIAFDSYDTAIETVGEGLNKGYFSKGADTIDEIAPIYTPPNSYNWANGVKFFSKEMALIASNL